MTAGDGALKCWGNNAYGQLGDGTTTTRYTPTLVPGLALLPPPPPPPVHSHSPHSHYPPPPPPPPAGQAALPALGGVHTCAYVTAGAGALKCWGSNGNGQLGDGMTTSYRLTPTTINVGGPVGLLALG